MDGATNGINPMLDPKGAGAALLRQGKFGEAAAVLKEAAAMTPDDEETFSLLGAALASNGDSSLAVDAFKKAAELGPTNPRSHFNLGLAYQAANRLGEARSALERAVNLNPGYDAARAKLAEVAQKMGGPSAAPAMGAAPEMQTTNIVGGGDSSMLLSVGSRYTPPGSASEGTTNISAGGDASSLASIGQQAAPSYGQSAAQADAPEGTTNISGGSGAGFSLSSVGTGRAPVMETGTTNIGGGATAAAPPSAGPALRTAPPVSVGPSSAAPSSAAPSSYAPPAPGGYAPPAPILGMNYGSDNTSGLKGDVPEEAARGFNWGAFLLNWLWLLNMRMVGPGVALLIGPSVVGGVIGGAIGGSVGPSGNGNPAALTSQTGALLALYGVLMLCMLGVSVYLGISGNKLAWRHRTFASIEDFKACQRIWAWWGLGLIIANVVIGILFGALMGAALVAGGAGGAGRRF